MYEDESNPSRETDTPSGALGDDEQWDVISTYSRAQAIEDGVLVDVSETAREAGIRFPVAVTSAVWNEYVALTPAARRAGNDEWGRLWDLITMLCLAILRNRSESCFLYDLLVVTDSVRPSQVTLKSMCGPGDDGEPVVTVLLPDED